VFFPFVTSRPGERPRVRDARPSSGPTTIRAVVNSHELAQHADLPSPSLISQSQVEEFYVLTWEAPKEMIFEMPVRYFRLPDPRGVRARARSPATRTLS
jgi:hypothetical protein